MIVFTPKYCSYFVAMVTTFNFVALLGQLKKGVLSQKSPGKNPHNSAKNHPNANIQTVLGRLNDGEQESASN